jgi:hypothetical protein
MRAPWYSITPGIAYESLHISIVLLLYFVING